MSKNYRVLRGIDFMTPAGEARRIEPGAVTAELPEESVAWLLEQQHIEEVAEEARSRRSSKAVHGPPEDKAEVAVADKVEGE